MIGTKISSAVDSVIRRFCRVDYIVIFFVALVARLALFSLSNDQVGTAGVLENCCDCTLYFNKALQIVAGTWNYENTYFYFGPGYPQFLAVMMRFVGTEPVFLITINIIISSLSCLLIAELALLLTRSTAIAFIAALLSALSWTSIGLSCMLMSDTFYFFIFLCGLLFFLKGMDSDKWIWFILTGLFFGMAILTRTVGQFWPVVMIVIAPLYLIARKRHPEKPPLKTKAIFGKVAVSLLIILILMSVWMARNYRSHGVPTLAITSGIGPANLAAVTIERLTGEPANSIIDRWVTEYKQVNGLSKTTLGVTFKGMTSCAPRIIDSLGSEIYKTYFILVWDNLTAICSLHRTLIPEYNNIIIPIEHIIKDRGYNYLSFIFSMAGLMILVLTARFRAAIILGSVYAYYVSMLGAFRWQGYRYFFPGQIASSILTAVTIVFIVLFMAKLARLAFSQIKSVYIGMRGSRTNSD